MVGNVGICRPVSFVTLFFFLLFAKGRFRHLVECIQCKNSSGTVFQCPFITVSTQYALRPLAQIVMEGCLPT